MTTCFDDDTTHFLRMHTTRDLDCIFCNFDTCLINSLQLLFLSVIGPSYWLGEIQLSDWITVEIFCISIIGYENEIFCISIIGYENICPSHWLIIDMFYSFIGLEKI